MPNNDIENNKSDTLDRLASLGEQFNTAKGFGMMGLMQQEQAEAAQAHIQSQQQAPAAAPATPAAVQPGGDDDEPPKWLDSVTSSMRAISDTTSRELGSLRNELHSIRQQPGAAPSQEEGEVDPVAQKLGAIEQTLLKTKLDTAWERARNSLNSAKLKYGDEFDFKEDNLRDVWRQHIGNNVGAAESTNWDVYMQQQYDSRRAPKLESRLKALEAELSRQKTAPVNDVSAGMAAVPRGNRNGAPQASGTLNGDFDEDVYREATQNMGKRIGSFSGFNRALFQAQTKKLLRSAG